MLKDHWKKQGLSGDVTDRIRGGLGLQKGEGNKGRGGQMVGWNEQGKCAHGRRTTLQQTGITAKIVCVCL